MYHNREEIMKNSQTHNFSTTNNEQDPTNNGPIVVSQVLSGQLLPHHRDHLYSEGFTTAHIEILINFGVRSLTEAQARSLGFLVKGPDGQLHCDSGIYFPFSDEFGQLRLDNPITRANGAIAKYLTPCGKTAIAYLPEGCQVVTEGFKDGMAGTLHGRIITGVLAGVSHYRKLPKGSGYTIIFDNDAWTNPSVMLNLIRAGLWVNGKINIIPKIPGKLKAGLCEYFQAGYTAEDYKLLIARADTPKELLFKWAEQFGDLAQKHLRDAFKKIFKLAAELLDEIEQHQLIQILQKITRFTLTVLKKWLALAVATVRKLKGDASNEDSSSKNESLYMQAWNELYNDPNHPYIYFQKQFWRYSGTHYEKINNVVELKRIHNYCKDYTVKKIGSDGQPILTYPYADPRYPQRIWKWAAEELGIDPQRVNPPGLNCTDGILQLKYDPATKQFNHQLVPHSPDAIYIYPPLVTYGATAVVSSQQCDRLLECLDPAGREIFLKTIGASFDLNFVRQHRGREVRALFLCGTGNNGKDALREAVSTLFGHQSITDASIGDFYQYDKGRKFTLAKLEGMNISWQSENSDTNLIDRIQSLKLAVTGDSLQIERKGVNEYSVKPKCQVLFNVNNPPQLLGAMSAIKSRYAFIKFNKTFSTHPGPGELQADPRFRYDPKFISTQVAPWLLKYCLDALDRLMHDGIDYSSTCEILEEIQEKTDHIYSFCRDTRLQEAPGEVLYAPDVYQRLQNWYVDQGFLEIESLPLGGTKGGERKKWYPPTTWGDQLVKGVNQVFPRLIKLFPKAKRSRDSTGRHYLTGLAFVSGGGGSPGAGGSPGVGGNPGAGGNSGAGGSPGAGGNSGAGGSPGTGGNSGAGGSPGTGGSSGTGGSPGAGSSPGTDGSPGAGSSPDTGGIPGTSSSPGTGGSSDAGSSPGTAERAPTDTTTSSTGANSHCRDVNGVNSNACYSCENGLKQSEDGLKIVKPNPDIDSERAEALSPKIEAKEVNLNFHEPVKKIETEKNHSKGDQPLQYVQNQRLVSVTDSSNCFGTASEDVQNGSNKIQNRVEAEAVPELVLQTELQAPEPVVFLLKLLAQLEADENCISCMEQLKQLWDWVSAAITKIHRLERQGVFVESWFDESDFWERAIPISDRIQQHLESDDLPDDENNSTNGGTPTLLKT